MPSHDGLAMGLAYAGVTSLEITAPLALSTATR